MVHFFKNGLFVKIQDISHLSIFDSSKDIKLARQNKHFSFIQISALLFTNLNKNQVKLWVFSQRPKSSTSRLIVFMSDKTYKPRPNLIRSIKISIGINQINNNKKGILKKIQITKSIK